MLMAMCVFGSHLCKLDASSLLFIFSFYDKSGRKVVERLLKRIDNFKYKEKSIRDTILFM